MSPVATMLHLTLLLLVLFLPQISINASHIIQRLSPEPTAYTYRAYIYRYMEEVLNSPVLLF